MIAEQLKSFPLLAGFETREIDALAHAAQSKRATEGQVVLRMGEANASLHLIVAGAVKVTRLGSEGEVMLATLKSGQAFGEMSFIDGSRTTAIVTAVEPTELLVIGRDAVDGICEASPLAWGKLWKNIALELRRRLALSTDLIDHLTDVNLILKDPALRDYYSQT